MNKTIHTLLCSFLLAASALAQHAFGPNGGRLVELAEGNPLQAEVTLSKEGKFVIGLYDVKTKMAVPVTTQTIVLTHKEKKAKLTPELKDGKWTVAKPEGDDFWLIMQVKPTAEAKALNARLHFDAGNCGGCSKAEWLCTCKHAGADAHDNHDGHDHGKKEEPKKDAKADEHEGHDHEKKEAPTK